MLDPWGVSRRLVHKPRVASPTYSCFFLGICSQTSIYCTRELELRGEAPLRILASVGRSMSLAIHNVEENPVIALLRIRLAADDHLDGYEPHGVHRQQYS